MFWKKTYDRVESVQKFIVKSAKIRWQSKESHELQWCTKSNLITISHSYEKKRMVELQISKNAMSHSKFVARIDVSRAINKHLLTLFDWNRNQMKFYITSVQKKIPTTDWKTRR